MSKALILEEKYIEKEYDSLEACLAAPDVDENNNHVRSINSNVRQKKIIAYVYSGNTLSLLLSSEKVLKFQLGTKSVICKLKDCVVRKNISPDFSEELHLQFDCGYSTQWKWKILLDEMLDQPINRITAGEVALWFYLENDKVFQFQGYTIGNGKEDFLYFFVDEDEITAQEIIRKKKSEEK